MLDHGLTQGKSISAGSCTVKQSTIVGTNDTAAIMAYGDVSIDSTIIQNTRTGVALNGGNTLSITNSNFVNVSSYCIRNSTVKAVSAPNNYWGTNVESAIKAKIYDAEDNVQSGLVTYSPFKSAAIPNLIP